MEVLTKSIAKHEDPHSDAYTVEYDYELLEDLGKPGIIIIIIINNYSVTGP